MSLFQDTFGAKEVAQAAGTTAGQVAEWARRGFIIGHDGGGNSGVRRRYSWFNVMQTAVAVKIIELLDTPPSTAFKLAVYFSDFGHGPSGWSGEKSDEPERHPGLPYHYSHGETWMTGNRKDMRVIVVPGREGPYPPMPGDVVFAAINLSEIFMVVVTRLELGGFRDILNEEYGR